MDPLTIFMAMAVGGSLLQAGGQFAGGASQARAMQANARQAFRQAQDVKRIAGEEAGMLREEGEAFKAEQRVGYLSSGIDIQSGTPLQVLAETAGKIEADARRIELQGNIDAYNLYLEGRQLQKGATATRRTTALGAGTTLLSSTANIARARVG